MWWLYPVSVVLIVVAVLARLAWVRHRGARPDPPILNRPVERFGKLTATEADELRARAEARRRAADAKYRASIQNTFDR